MHAAEYRRLYEEASRAAEEGATAQPDQACVVCWDAGISVGTDPCGHVCLCAGCASQLSSCPLCRAAITRRFRAGQPAVGPPPAALDRGVSNTISQEDVRAAFVERMTNWKSELEAWAAQQAEDNAAVAEQLAAYHAQQQADWSSYAANASEWQAAADAWNENAALWWADLQRAAAPAHGGGGEGGEGGQHGGEYAAQSFEGDGTAYCEQAAYDESLEFDGAYHGSPTWSKLFDPATNHFYFYNNDTGESVWEEPADYWADAAAPLPLKLWVVLRLQAVFRGFKSRKEKAAAAAAAGAPCSGEEAVADEEEEAAAVLPGAVPSSAVS